MADTVRRAVPTKAPRPAAGSSVPARGEPATLPSNSAPPPSAGRPPVGGTTEATDIIAGRGARPPVAPVEDELRTTGIHAVPTTGDRIGGKYVVDKLLGSGGMGLVVSAKNEQTGERVAIKLLRPKAAGDKIHAERFAREARAIVKIKSEHVVKVLDAGTLSESDAPFIVMEYLSGRDLSQTIREDGPLPIPIAADMMLQVCDAVASAHAVGVVHRDLKPSNFFVMKDAVTGRPRVKVLDFGIAKAIGTDGVVDPNLTETQAVFGSPTYMSPEQIRSAKHVDHRSDIWSLGVALYEVTTGRLPFAADNVAGLLASIVADPPYYPRGFVPDMPPVFEELLLACLHKDPKQRVQSAGDLGTALAPFATPGPQTDALLASIVKASPPTFQPFPGETGPRLPQGSWPGAGPQPSGAGFPSAPPGNISAPSWPGLPPPDSHRTSGVAFGSTGSDLHAAMPKPVGRKIGAAVGAVLLLAVLGGGAVLGTRALKKPVAVPGAPTSIGTSPQAETAAVAPAPASSSVTAASAPPAASSAPVSSADPVASSSAKGPPRKLPRLHPPPGPKPASAPTPGKAVDPTGDRF